MSGERNFSIDSFRFIAICMVVMLHTATNVQGASPSGIFLNQLARFAVPFFFIASGFFFYQKAIKAPSAIFSCLFSYGSRIFLIYVVWYVIYATWALYSPAHWDQIAQHGFMQELLAWGKQFWSQFNAHRLYFLIGGGRGFHLWFLPALGMAICLLALALRVDMFITGFVFAVALFLIALLVAPYRNSAVGLPFGFEPRNGPFFSSIFVFIGAALARYQVGVSMPVALGITAAGFLLSLCEVTFIQAIYGLSPSAHNFVISTVIYATGVALVALSDNSLGVKFKLPELGKLALGVYVSHVLLMWFLQAVALWPSNNFLRFSVCLLGSILLTKSLISIPGIRKVVS